VTPEDRRQTPTADTADATGNFRATLNATTRKLTWDLTFVGLGTPTLPIADIHLGRLGHFGAVIVRLCAPCQRNDRGVATVNHDDIPAVLSGASWVTVITERHPIGVIRGQITSK
jgi:hypothetical protein